MTRCPKCGWTVVIGPHYVRSLRFGVEALRYICQRCGYAREEPTRDAHNVKRAILGYPKK